MSQGFRGNSELYVLGEQNSNPQLKRETGITGVRKHIGKHLHSFMTNK